jgi:hypothetical protein
MYGQGRLKITWKLIASSLLYIVFAVYLVYPYLQQFNKWQYLWPLNFCIASIGCYILSRRWIAGFAGSLFAGVIYGFGPYMLGLAKFHPITGLLAAAVPWLFLPAAFALNDKWKLFRIPLALIPFMGIILFFRITNSLSLFPASTHAKLYLNELYSLFAPLVAAKQGTTLIGFYHVPIAALVMGIAMLVSTRRYSIILIITASITLVFCDSFNYRLSISPLLWLSIAILCFSITIGAGIQGLLSIGFEDRKWILANSIVLAGFAILTLLFAAKYFQIFLSLGDGYARLFVQAAKMYLLGSIVLLIFFFMTRGKLKLSLLREFLLGTAIALDILISAGFIFDMLF